MLFTLRNLLYCLVGLLSIVSTAIASLTTIDEIRFTGNKKTKPAVMLQEMRTKIGGSVDLIQIEYDRQAIMDLGLFKYVYADVIEVDGQQVLEITVSEKYYLFPLPKLDRSADGDISYGVRLKMDNIAGLNQSMRMTFKQVDGCCDALGKSNQFDLSYNYPRIAGSPFGLRVGVLYTDAPVDDKVSGGVTSIYGKEYQAFSFGVNRWLRQDEPSIGWSAWAGPFWRSAKYSYVSGFTGLYEDGRAVGVDLGVSYSRVHDYLYSREGTEYGYSIQIGSRALGSDGSFTQSNFYYRRYYYVNSERHRNLNVQLLVGFSGGVLPLGGDFFAIGGSRSVRGYEKGSLRGASFFTLNLEYLTPVRGNNALRGVLFADVGNAYADNRTVDPDDIKSTLGLGVRYKMKSFVKVDLRFDTAYALDDRDLVVYFSTKGTF